jgi:hypothetical protein
MRERARELAITIPSNWWRGRDHEGQHVLELFVEAKERIARMECRVVPFIDDVRGIRSTVSETYIHAVLGTPYNDFSTS